MPNMMTDTKTPDSTDTVCFVHNQGNKILLVCPGIAGLKEGSLIAGRKWDVSLWWGCGRMLSTSWCAWALFVDLVHVFEVCPGPSFLA